MHSSPYKACCSKGAVSCSQQLTLRQSAASCELFCWRQSLCHAKGGSAAELQLYCCMRVEQSSSGVGAAVERCERGV